MDSQNLDAKCDRPKLKHKDFLYITISSDSTYMFNNTNREYNLVSCKYLMVTEYNY